MNTFLFDLDGTLLPLDMEEFTHAYFTQLSKKLSPKLDPQVLPKLVWASTEYMIKNLEDSKTNMESFFEDFKTRIDVELEELMPLFDEFYKFDFEKLKDVVNPNPITQDIVNILKRKGYTLVVATNPLFPQEAIYHRIKWAGLSLDDFSLITSYENMHFCKPNLEYYQEILKIIDKKPEDAIMVGNDVQEDMIVSKLGIKTFLIDDYLINRGNQEIKSDFRGSMGDLLNYVNSLPVL